MLLAGDIVHPKLSHMYKILAIASFLLISSGCFAQIIGKVDKKTKEFSIAAGQKGTYMVFGYQFANATTPKMICFASSEDVTRANQNLLLGSYFDTDRLPPGDRITYLGIAGTFGKMSFTTGTGKTVIFYLPRSSYAIK
jgi:hypothetical protein